MKVGCQPACQKGGTSANSTCKALQGPSNVAADACKADPATRTRSQGNSSKSRAERVLACTCSDPAKQLLGQGRLSKCRELVHAHSSFAYPPTQQHNPHPLLSPLLAAVKLSCSTLYHLGMAPLKPWFSTPSATRTNKLFVEQPAAKPTPNYNRAGSQQADVLVEVSSDTERPVVNTLT
jgi:hypothetical protein